MTNRLLVRLGILAGSVTVLAVLGLVVLVSATSTPQLPPPPLPTATTGPVADPNSRVQSAVQIGALDVVMRTGLIYTDAGRPQIRTVVCGPHGYWSLDVNPQDVIGHPYAASPSRGDWVQAAAAANTASATCPAPIMIAWYSHDSARPSSDRWMTVLPASVAATIHGPSLQRYAMRHARQI